MAAMADNPRSQASKATGQCLQRYLAATMHRKILKRRSQNEIPTPINKTEKTQLAIRYCENIS